MRLQIRANKSRVARLFAEIDPPENLTGYRYFWLKYLRGFDHTQHCARCLIGDWSRVVKPTMRLNEIYSLNESSAFSCLYLCGVANTGYADNFHIPFIEAPGETIKVQTFNDLLVVIENGRQLPITPLPDYWGNLPKSFTTCRNYQFALRYFLGQDVKPADLRSFATSCV